jgi:hypothetical protein
MNTSNPSNKSQKAISRDHPLPEDAIAGFYKGKMPGHHMEDSFECIRTREERMPDVYMHHRSVTTCHPANSCLQVGRSLTWDPKAEQIIGDAEANGMQRRESRKGFEISI